MIRNPALKYFLVNGLKKIDNLPEKEIAAMRLALALNFDSKEGFLKAMSSSGIDKQRLGLIFDNETHQAQEFGDLETAQQTGMGTKVWNASGGDSCCKKCASMNGESVPLGSNFSNGCAVAHLHPDCQCKTTFEKAAAATPDRIYTRGELAGMSPDEYSAARDTILEQYASGMIK